MLDLRLSSEQRLSAGSSILWSWVPHVKVALCAWLSGRSGAFNHCLRRRRPLAVLVLGREGGLELLSPAVREVDDGLSALGRARHRCSAMLHP